MKIRSVEDYESRIKEILITPEEIKRELKRAGKFIDSLYDGRPVLLVSVLKGSFIFLADLAREVTVPCEIGFMCVKSYYEGTASTGTVQIVMDLEQDVSNYHVVIVEDIVDTGRTLRQLTDMFAGKKTLSLHIVTLLDKPDRRVVEITPDMSLFTIPDRFVIGYGLDCAEYYRTLPCIAVYGED